MELRRKRRQANFTTFLRIFVLLTFKSVTRGEEEREAVEEREEEVEEEGTEGRELVVEEEELEEILEENDVFVVKIYEELLKKNKLNKKSLFISYNTDKI